jgi:methylglyoxal reductase
LEYRELGKSGLRVPVVSFGGWAAGGWCWGGTDDANAIRAIQCGIDRGITCVDTAPMYGMGHGEEVVGKALAGRRDKVVLATKCGLRWDTEEGDLFFETRDLNGEVKTIHRHLGAAAIKWECEQSLLRLNVDVIDLYQCHFPVESTPIHESMGALLELRQEGKIRAFGVSNFQAGMLAECLKTADIVSLQPRYSALDRRVEEEVLPFCIEHNLGILAYSPIEQGLLSGKVTVDREFSETDDRRYSHLFSNENRQKILDMLERVRPIAEGHDATFAQLFVAWLVAQPGVTTAIVGARNEAQVVENARAGEIKLSDEEIAEIRAQVEALDW